MYNLNFEFFKYIIINRFSIKTNKFNSLDNIFKLLNNVISLILYRFRVYLLCIIHHLFLEFLSLFFK